MLSIIVAKTKNNVIGNNNKMLWHITEDLKRFRKLTTNHVVIMGRKTFESLNKPLPDRTNIIVSRSKQFAEEIKSKFSKDGDVIVINDIKDLNCYIKCDEECFVIGGSEIFKELMPYSTRLYVTEIDATLIGDAYFPHINMKDWKITSRVDGQIDPALGFDYYYMTYERANAENLKVQKISSLNYKNSASFNYTSKKR